MPETVAVLTYLSRSGSTLLSSLLDRFEAIAVTLEARLPDGIDRPAFQAGNEEDLSGEVERLYGDEKFRSWGIPQAELHARLSALSYPLGFAALFRQILNEVSGPATEITIFKNGNYLFHLPVLKQQFPQLKVIHIVRDCRAIFASQQHALDSRTGKPMATVAMRCALTYNLAYRICTDAVRTSWFLQIRYEDLLRDTDKTLQVILDFLEIQNRGTRDIATYGERIPDGQKHLHRNVTAPPDAARIDAWQARLSAAERRTIEIVAGDALRGWGYEIPSKPPSLLDCLYLAWQAVRLGIDAANARTVGHLFRYLRHRNGRRQADDE